MYCRNGEILIMEKIVQTAGRQQLGEFAPEFAHFNDDVLFGLFKRRYAFMVQFLLNMDSDIPVVPLLLLISYINCLYIQ